MQGFDGKVAIVTGGAQGIGAAVVSRLVNAGTSVVVADISAEGESFAASLRLAGKKAVFVRVDVSRAADIKAMVSAAEEEFDGLDLLINNAGIFPRAGLQETTEALWDQVLAVNLKGVFLACQAAAPAMARRGGGAIVNVGSLHAAGGSPDLLAYAVSKGGVVTLTRNLARALARDKIRVNCVHPGWVSSEGEIRLRRAEGMPENWPEVEGKKLPFGRLQTSADVADAIVFLASDASSQITGQFLAVDGGLSLP